MEKLAVIGPFSEVMKEALREAIPEHFRFEYITDYAEYGKLADAEYIVLRTLELKGEHLQNLKKCKLIQRWGVGFDSVDIVKAGEHGIPVAVATGANSIPVSELAVGLMLAVYRNVVPMSNEIMSGSWNRDEYSKKSYTISGKTIGLFGMGNIGKKVAALCNAFGAQVLYYDPYRLSSDQEEQIHVTYCEADSLWQKSDIISLHSPLQESTYHMANEQSLASMKPGAILINTARPELVDMKALAGALHSGHLLGAGLDAIDESILSDNPFTEKDNVVLTAHLGGNTADNAIHMAKACAKNILAVSSGIALSAPALVNGEYLKG